MGQLGMVVAVVPNHAAVVVEQVEAGGLAGYRR
jgi:hypothetical protein